MSDRQGPVSQAALRRERLVRDRSTEFDDLMRTAASDAGYSSADLELLRSGEGRHEFLEAGGASPGLWPMVQRNLPPYPAARRDVAGLLVCDIQHDQFSAVCNVEDDESGIVLVSDGLLGLLVHLAQLLSFSVGDIGVSRRGMAKLVLTALRNDRSTLSKQQQTVEALLRYHLVQQKVFGCPGKLAPRLSNSEAEFAAVLFQTSLWFILAHEAAHFRLGHPSLGISTIDGQRLHTVNDSTELELEADDYALRATVQGVSEMGVDGTSAPQGGDEAMAGMGAALALLAVELTEAAVLVRRTRTHPAASVRWRALVDTHGESLEAADTVVGFVRAPLLRNAPPQADLRPKQWKQTFRSRRVTKLQVNNEALEYTPMFDRALHGPLLSPASWDDLDPAVPLLSGAHREIVGGHSLRSTFTRLRVGEEDIEYLLNPTVGLSFFGVLDIIDNAPNLLLIENRELRRLIAIALTRAFAARIADC